MSSYHNIYLVGIKGVGMTSLALYLKSRGKNVWGSDVDEIFPTDSELQKQNIEVLKGFSEDHVTNSIDLLITTGAHSGLNNKEVIRARELGIQVMTQAEEVGHIMQSYATSISVCGSHGKTTTSSMLAYVLRKLGLFSSHIIGTPDFSGLPGGLYKGEEYLVVESDEYVNSPGIDNTPRFLFQHPTYIICTNIEHDHPDVYPNLESVEKAFSDFFNQSHNRGGIIIYNADAENVSRLCSSLPSSISVGYYSDSTYKILDVEQHERNTEFTLAKGDENVGRFTISVPGKHNVFNAACVIALCSTLKLDLEMVKNSIKDFEGARRRFETKYRKGNTYLIDDYAHHPTEINALIEAARSRFPDRKIILLFQPHTYSRTKELYAEFIKALSHADLTYVLDIFASARESVDRSVSSQNLVQEAHSQGYDHIFYASESEIDMLLRKGIEENNIVITAGAGNIYKHHPAIIGVISEL